MVCSPDRVLLLPPASLDTWHINPWSWFYLWLKDVFCDHAVQGRRDGFFALNWHLASCLLDRCDAGVYLDVYSPFKLPILLKEFGDMVVSCSLSLIKAPTGSWNIGFSLHRGNSFTEPTLVTSLGSCWHWSCPWPFIL